MVYLVGKDERLSSNQIACFMEGSRNGYDEEQYQSVEQGFWVRTVECTSVNLYCYCSKDTIQYLSYINDQLNRIVINSEHLYFSVNGQFSFVSTTTCHHLSVNVYETSSSLVNSVKIFYKLKRSSLF